MSAKLPLVRNDRALIQLHRAIATLAVAATIFQETHQHEHEAQADQAIDIVAKLIKAVSK